MDCAGEVPGALVMVVVPCGVTNTAEGAGVTLRCFSPMAET